MCYLPKYICIDLLALCERDDLTTDDLQNVLPLLSGTKSNVLYKVGRRWWDELHSDHEDWTQLAVGRDLRKEGRETYALQ